MKNQGDSNSLYRVLSAFKSSSESAWRSIGHNLFSLIHLMIHSLWKTCLALQGTTVTSESPSNGAKQITHSLENMTFLSVLMSYDLRGSNLFDQNEYRNRYSYYSSSLILLNRQQNQTRIKGENASSKKIWTKNAALLTVAREKITIKLVSERRFNPWLHSLEYCCKLE